MHLQIKSGRKLQGTTWTGICKGGDGEVEEEAVVKLTSWSPCGCLARDGGKRRASE